MQLKRCLRPTRYQRHSLYVADNSGTLIVMGGYGHARLRGVILGGVTREMLKSMTVPEHVALKGCVRSAKRCDRTLCIRSRRAFLGATIYRPCRAAGAMVQEWKLSNRRGTRVFSVPAVLSATIAFI